MFSKEMVQCQSCGMPLVTRKTGDLRGFNSDGSPSDKWCNLCFENGEFLGPDCTLEEMLKIVDQSLRKQKAWFFMRRFALKQIPTLERWR